MRVHQRRQFGQQQATDGGEVALALEHVGEFRQIGLQPVLLGVHVRRETEVRDHRVDVVFQLRDLAAGVDLDRPRQVALGHGGRHFRDRAHLRGEVGRQQIDVAGEILPGAGGAGHVGLTAEPALDADLARHRRHLVGERRERLGHVVDGVGQRRDLALRFHGEVLLEIAVGDRGHHLDDAADLLGQVRRHEIDGVGEILPGAGDAGHLGLATEFAFGADLARNARDFAGERIELVHHGVDGVLELENFALHVDGDLARQVAARDGGGDFGDVADLGGEVRGQQVDVIGEVLPSAADAGHDGLAAEPALGADLTCDARHFRGEGAELLDHGVQGILEQQNFAAHIHRDLLRQVAAGDRGRDLGDVADLRGEVRCHEVDVVGEILPGAGNAGHFGLAAKLAFGADLAGDPRDFTGKAVELVHHGVDGVLQLQNLATDVDRNLAREVAARHGGGDFGDVADLGGEVARHRIDAVGEVFPGAGDAGHVGLAAEPAFGADLARDARHLAREAVELVDHRVQRVLELKDLAAHVHGDLARQVATGDRSRDFGDVADLGGEVARHRVDAVGEVLPGAGDAGDFGLAAELAFGADLARGAGEFGGEGVELVDHGVERFLQLKDFAGHVDGDFLRQIALGDRGRDFGDVADLAGQVRAHRVDAVGEILPGAGDAAHLGLAAELAFGADLAGDARDFAGKGVELVHHGVDGVFQLQDLAADIDGDLFRQIATRDRGRHLGDVADLCGQVRGHRVDALGQVLPGAGDAEHVGLTAEPALGADLARDARDFAGEGVELVDHGVERFLQLKDFARDVHRDLLREVSARDGGGNVGDVADLRGEVRRHEVDVVGEVLPGTGYARHLGLAAELAFGADLARHARHFRGERVELVHHGVDGVFQLQDFASYVHRDLARQVAARHGGGDVGDVAHLRGEVAAHGVDAVGEILPGAGDAGHDGLAAKLAVGADLARHARHFRGKGTELVHHRVDGFLELKDLAADVDRDLLREVAVRNCDRHLGDVANLVGQVVRHRVDALGQILPDAGHFRHLGLAAELAFGADLARHARHFGGEHAELLDHGVDDGRRLQEFAAQGTPIDVELDGLEQVALCHGCDRARHLAGRPQQIVDQRVDGAFHVGPGAGGQPELHALARLALAAHHLADQLELLRHALIGGDDVVESVGELAVDAEIVAAHAHGEIAVAHGLQGEQQFCPGIGLRHAAGFWLWNATTGT